MFDTINSYCLSCHDNTTFVRIGAELPIDNYQGSGNIAVFAKFKCSVCGRKNLYYNYIFK